MKLVIAEKPSVAKAISDVLGAKTRRDGSYEGGGYAISWCLGHLLELAEPKDYDEKYVKWRYADLPIVPGEWKYVPVENTKKQLKILADLMKRPDVDCIVNACDAGREGELIFRLVYSYCACRKPIQRLWISSMEESAITEGFRNLRPGSEYDRLYQAAACRQQADWLVGLNYSRLFSVLYDANLSVGRVQTPTLAMIVERERKINGFVKEPFYTVLLTGSGITAEREKVRDKAVAEVISAACNGNTAIVKFVEKREKSTAPPKLYDLTTLQREANRIFGYTASQTLNCVQNLYEQRLSTYPRTDSQYLTEDMATGLPALVSGVAAALPFTAETVSINTAQVINSSKVTDHHAIIPTPGMAKADITALPTADRNILTMICVRLVSAVADRHIYNETAVTMECAGEVFTVKGKTVKHNGWKTIEQAFYDSIGKQRKNDEPPLPELYEGQRFSIKTDIREGFTKPPEHYTEDTLLSAMENAGADDMPSSAHNRCVEPFAAVVNAPGRAASVPDDAERKGLGTPATRAGILENLIKSGLLERKGKQILPTEKGVSLIKVLPESVKSPYLTAEWENHLKRLERNELTAADIMADIVKYVDDTVKTYTSVPDEYNAMFPSTRPAGERVGACPRCGGNVSEASKGFFCENKACKFGLFKDNKFFAYKKKKLTKDIVKTLLAEGRIFMSGLVSEKTGKTYNAEIILDDKGDGYPGFRMEFKTRLSGR
ncbi:MAG: DNA topoisomerase III [Clostridiales bacterium]|nr:DNA topoisomerase III [Clostridiales bacterium]